MLIEKITLGPYKKNINRENPTILVTGFWPPTNEMIRHFSQNENLKFRSVLANPFADWFVTCLHLKILK